MLKIPMSANLLILKFVCQAIRGDAAECPGGGNLTDQGGPRQGGGAALLLRESRPLRDGGRGEGPGLEEDTAQIRLGNGKE